MKKILSLLCVVLLLVSLSTAAFAVKTPDQAETASVSTSLDMTSYTAPLTGAGGKLRI